MKSIFIVLTAAAVFVSCKKDKPNNGKQGTITINPMKEIAAASTQGTSEGSEGKYQVGVRFIAYKEGTISRLGLRSPSAGTYRVQLYTFVSNDSAGVYYPLISEPERIGYADITIDADAASKGTVVWSSIPTANIKLWNADGAGKARHYAVCYNDLDKTQYQVTLSAGATLPLGFGNVISVGRYGFLLTDDLNISPWHNGSLGSYVGLVYGGEQFEFVTAK